MGSKNKIDNSTDSRPAHAQTSDVPITFPFVSSASPIIHFLHPPCSQKRLKTIVGPEVQAKCIVGDMEVGNTERKSFLIVLGTERFFLASWLRKSR